MLRLLLLAGLLLTPTLAVADQLAPAPAMQGDTRIHDPSAIDVNGHWVTFQTGEEGGLYQGAILLKTSPDGVTWSNAGAIGKGVPKWTQGLLGYKSRNIWAPIALAIFAVMAAVILAEWLIRTYILNRRARGATTA